MIDRLIKEVVDGCNQRAGQSGFTFSRVLAAAGAALGQPVLAGLVPRRSEAATLRPGEAVRVAGGICPSIRSTGLEVEGAGLIGRSFVWITFAVTNENKHRRAAGKDQSARPFSRSDQRAIGGISS